MTPQELVAALRHESEDEHLVTTVSLASYRAWHAGVAWGAKHGTGEWDDASEAWIDWWNQEQP